MKKGIAILSLILLTLVGVKGVNAAKSDGFNAGFDIASFEVKKETFQDIVDYDDSSLLKETKSDGSIVFYKEYVGSDFKINRYGEWFKKINGKLVNYKETVEKGYKSKDEKHINDVEEIEYHVDANKCKSDVKLINDNCQSKNRKKLMRTFYLNNRIFAKNIVIYNTNNKYSRDDTYSRSTTYTMFGDKMIITYDFDIKRDSKNRITKVFAKIHDLESGYEYIESGRIDKRNSNSLYNLNNLKVYTLIDREFDSKKRLIGYHETDTEGVELYTKEIGYFSNNKQRFVKITKRSENEQLTYVGKRKNLSNGHKRGDIRYGFKKGVMNVRYEYVYNKNGNKKGNAYRFKTTYNKKGKKLKTYKSFYNKKGKIYKTKKAKHRVDFK